MIVVKVRNRMRLRFNRRGGLHLQQALALHILHLCSKEGRRALAYIALMPGSPIITKVVAVGSGAVKFREIINEIGLTSAFSMLIMPANPHHAPSFHLYCINTIAEAMTAPSIVARPPPLELFVDCRRNNVTTYRTVKIQVSEEGDGSFRDSSRRKPTTSDATVQAEPTSIISIDSSQTKVSKSYKDKGTELSRRLQPKSDADYGTLQAELQMWRNREQNSILASHPAVQIGLEQEALAKEGFLLRKIDSLRTEEHRDRRTRRVDGELAEMAQPKYWTMASGERIQVTIPATARAGNLRRIYNGLAEKVGDSRKEYLLEARAAVNGSLEQTTDAMSVDLVELIDRELDLLHRGVDKKVLQSLNNRVRNLFLIFIQDGRHNPAATAYTPTSFVEPIVKIIGHEKNQ